MAGPLAGVTILDFSWFEQGPLACAYLGDLGARVIKVEPPFGDPVRGALRNGISSAFIAHNRGKESITLNLRSSAGREVLSTLAAAADVLVHNFTDTVAHDLGLDYATLGESQPRLIYVWASGFGPRGPLRDALSMDVIAQAYGGLVSVTGEADGGPLPAGAAIADATGAKDVFSAVLLGLYQRERSGRGCKIDVSLYGGQLSLQAWELLHSGITNEFPSRAGTGHPLQSMWGIFATADGHLALASVRGLRWRQFCAAIGLPALADDPRFTADSLAPEVKAELQSVVGCQIRGRTTGEWVTRLRAADIIAGPVQSYAGIHRDEQAWESGYLQRFSHPELGEVTGVVAPLTVDGVPGQIQGPPPELGQHTELLLLELGYSWDQIGRLRDANAL